MAKLRGGLSTVEYFTFGFGTMIGVGWVVLMDDWLSRGGPGGGMLGFLLGGLLLFSIGPPYGRVVQRTRARRGPSALSDRHHLGADGAAHPRRRRRNRLHGRGVPAARQFFRRVDDDPVVRDRV